MIKQTPPTLNHLTQSTLCANYLKILIEKKYESNYQIDDKEHTIKLI